MNRSTIVMICNNSGYTNPSSTKGWGIVDFDWSNAKALWASAKPMNCEELLVEQVALTTAASPGTTVWVYRNAVKALPWYSTVRAKLTDPAYGEWFLNFSGTGKYHVPQCDTNYEPPLCTSFYHDQDQTPGYPSGDGDCSPPACDVGSVPIGEYLFNHLAANVSVNGQSFVQWFIDDYVFGPTGGSNANVSGFYFDDEWTPIGPSEMNEYALIDLGFNASHTLKMTVAWAWVMDQVYAEIIARKKFSWNQLWTFGNDCPQPLVKQPSCIADLRSLCRADSSAQTRAMMFAFSPGSCAKGFDPGNLTDFDADLANFLLSRGPYAYLGNGWTGCSRIFEYPDALNLDYGEPLGLCAEIGIGTGVFERNWTKATVRMDCNSWTPSITLHAPA